MWLICFIFLLIALIPLYIAKEKNTWKSNKEFQQKDMKLRHYSSGIAPDAPGGILRNYVEEFRYANELYKKLWTEFQEAHPIGSIFDYTDMDGEQSMLITSKKDQREALDKAYIFSALSGVYNNGVEQYCLGEARKHIVELGYAPDNVKERIFPGYNVHHIGSQPTNYSFGSKNVETRYDSWFVFTTGYGGWSALIDRRDPHMSSQYKEKRRYLCGIMSYDGDTDSRYTKLFLEELKRYEDEENAVIRHRYETGRIDGPLRADPEQVKACNERYLKKLRGVDPSGVAMLALIGFIMLIPFLGWWILGFWSWAAFGTCWGLPAMLVLIVLWEEVKHRF